MKARIPAMSKRQKLEFKQELYGELQESMDTVLKDREVMAGCRAQWMLLVALCRRYGFGKKRLQALLLEVESMLPSLIEDREAECMDEMLIRDLERAGLDIRGPHKEYFEAQERLKQFGKFIDREKEQKEAERKEKELLEKLRRKEMIFGKEKTI